MLAFFTGTGLTLILGGILLFAAVVLIVVGVGALLSEQEFVQRRLAAPRIATTLDEATAAGSIILEDGLLKRFDAIVTPQSQSELTQIRRRLIQAGYRKPSAVRVFYASKAILAVGFALLALGVVPFLPGLPLPLVGMIVIFAMLIGYIFPSFWIQRTYEYRRLSAELGFPDLLDMLLLCIA